LFYIGRMTAFPLDPPGDDAAQRRRPEMPARVGTLRGVAGGAVAYAGPNRIAAYRDIDALDHLGVLAEPHRLRLGVPMWSPPPAPLFDEAEMPERIANPHRTRLLAPAAEIYAVPGHELGGFGLLQRHGRVWANDAVQPPYINDRAQPGRLDMPDFWTRGLLTSDAEVIETDTPVGVVLHPNVVYGHFLLEMFPRLLLLARLRTIGRPVPVAVPIDGPEWLRAFIALLFDASETIFYDSTWQRLRAPCFILPSRLNDDYNFHPEMNAAIEDFLGRVLGPRLPAPRPPAHVYLSRSRFGGWHGIANEAEVERALIDLGFAVVHPQELSLPDQLALYAGADCIVADYGSAAHNALFAPRGAAVFCINWLSRCQSGIAALRGQPLAFMAPDGAGFHDPTRHRDGDELRPRVNPAELARQVTAFLRFAETCRAGDV
jgi:Glycosyltransferase 61